MIRRILAIVLAFLMLLVGLPNGAAVATDTCADNTGYDPAMHSYRHGLLLASSEGEPAPTRGEPHRVQWRVVCASAAVPRLRGTTVSCDECSFWDGAPLRR